MTEYKFNYVIKKRNGKYQTKTISGVLSPDIHILIANVETSLAVTMSSTREFKSLSLAIETINCMPKLEDSKYNVRKYVLANPLPPDCAQFCDDLFYPKFYVDDIGNTTLCIVNILDFGHYHNYCLSTYVRLSLEDMDNIGEQLPFIDAINYMVLSFISPLPNMVDIYRQTAIMLDTYLNINVSL